MPAYCGILERDRHRRGFTEGQVAWRVGISVVEYRQLLAGEQWPDPDIWDRVCELFGWPSAEIAASQDGAVWLVAGAGDPPQHTFTERCEA